MAPNPLIATGIEPVDQLMGGLHQRSIYLVHGESSETSIFGIRFVIEGLKRGETAALIMGYSPEDAIRRFALLGYDCLEDIYAGRLVILEYTDDTIEQIATVSEFAPVLRELEWLLGETKPSRIFFDPVTTVLARKDQHLATRLRQFIEWAARLGATVVLGASSTDRELLRGITPLVSEAFGFDKQAREGGIERSLHFAKSGIDATPVDIDPSRGIFLSKSAPAHPLAGSSAANLPQSFKLPSTLELDVLTEGPLIDSPVIPDIHQPDPALAERQSHSGSSNSALDSFGEPGQAPGDEYEGLVNDVMGTASVLDLRFLDDEPPPFRTEPEIKDQTSPSMPDEEPPRVIAPMRYSRKADAKIGAALASHAVESLLKTPASVASVKPAAESIPEKTDDETAEVQPQPGDFNILVVTDDQRSRNTITSALSGYSLQFVQDGVAALAKLISIKPDVVVLDVELPILDGFKVLEHIRTSLNVPIIIMSGSRVRASDRVLATELGADYFLTKPFSGKELAQKSRQLIARHRGITSWVLTRQPQAPPENQQRDPKSIFQTHFAKYEDFAAEIERRVEAAIGGGAAFSVVGCRLPEQRNQGVPDKLSEIVRDLARDSDLTTINAQNDLLVLLPDANAAGARSFANRLRARVVDELRQEPTFWIRTFPESALAARANGSTINQAEAQLLHRRASDSPSDSPEGPREQSSKLAMGATPQR